MMLFMTILIFLFNTATSSKTALFISGRDTGSHQESMRHYFTALKNAGYDVTVLDTSNEKLKQYPGVSMKQFYIPPDFSGRKGAIIRFLTKPYNGFSMMNAQVDGNKFMMELIEQKWGELSALLATPYDLIVIDDIPCVHCAVISSVLNRIHGSKVVLFSTTKPLDYNMILLGLTKSIAINPYIFTVMPRNSDDIMDFRKFKDRISNIKLWAYEICGFLMTDEASTISSANYLGLPAFQWSSFYQKIGLSVIESIDYNIWPIPTLQMIKHTGIHCERPNFSKIPQDLKVFIEDPASKGTIYIAFGSYIDFTYAPEHLIEALVNGVQRLSEYRVVVSVKINGTKIAKQPYVRYVEWSPQIEILSHPKTKAFLTHGGLKSIKESICAKVPIVIMPLFAEQSANAQLVGRAKIGRILNKFTVNEHVFAEEIKTAAKDPIYKKNIVKIHDLWTERPISQLDEVVFMTTKYAKFDNRVWKKYFEPKSKKLSIFKTYCMDLLAVFLLVTSVISFL